MTLWKKLLLTGLILGGTFSSTNLSESSISRPKMSLEEITNRINSSYINNLDSLYKFSEEDLQKFNSWVDSTINESAKNNKNSILINKSSRSLYLIKNGEVDSEYNVDFGKNQYNDKQKEGDFCTPEGIYTVKRKFNQSNFYKTVSIDYPNAEDRAKGKTGSHIEIHGHGDKGYNWTRGCIALSNENMDEIFQYLNKGDRITIVRYTSRKLIKHN